MGKKEESIVTENNIGEPKIKFFHSNFLLFSIALSLIIIPNLLCFIFFFISSLLDFSLKLSLLYDSDNCRFFSLSKTKAISFPLVFPIALERKKEQQLKIDCYCSSPKYLLAFSYTMLFLLSYMIISMRYF